MFVSEKYDAIYNRIRYLISLKSSIIYIFSQYSAEIKVDSYDSLPVEKRLTLNNVITLMKSVLNKDKNHYHYKVLLEICLYQLGKNNHENYFHSMIMLTLGETKMIKEKLKMEIKIKNNKLISFRIDNGKLLERYETICIKIESLKNIELNFLPVYDNRYIKSEIRIYENVPGDDVECKSFTVIFIDFLLVYKNKYYLQVYLGNCDYKSSNKKMADYLDDNLFEN